MHRQRRSQFSLPNCQFGEHCWFRLQPRRLLRLGWYHQRQYGLLLHRRSRSDQFQSRTGVHVDHRVPSPVNIHVIQIRQFIPAFGPSSETFIGRNRYGTGQICAADFAVQYDAGRGLCCGMADAATGACTSWCQPGATDCIDPTDRNHVILTQADAELAQGYFQAAAVALEQYAAAIPSTDDTPAESPASAQPSSATMFGAVVSGAF